MTSRRQFLQIGVTATALPLASGAARAAGGEMFGRGVLKLYRAVYDRRFDAGQAFARRASALGLPLEAIEGDMTSFWYEDLYHVWKREPVAVAGLTAHGPMFCFEQLGRDRGMRIVFRAVHRFGMGFVEHELTGPVAMLEHGKALESGSDWSACMADVVAECPSGRTEVSTMYASTPSSPQTVSWGVDPLYSWVLAPASRI